MNWSDIERKWGRPSDTTPLQVPDELDSFLEVFKAHNPKRVLEIGVMHGGTLWFWCKHTDPDARIIGLDLDIGLIAQSLSEFDRKLTRLNGASQSPDTVNRVAAHLDQPLDALWIDADHTGDNPIRDFEAYAPFLRTGALVAFHDVDCKALPDVGVCWQKLKAQFPQNRTFSVGQPESMGIGMFFYYP